MPVIPSFGSFAGTTNLAAAYTSGAHVGLEQQRIAQQAAQAGAEIDLQKQKLAESAKQAQMELQAKEQLAQQAQLRQQQEMELEKAYKESMIGIHQRQLEQAAQKLQMSTKLAAQKFAAQQEMSGRISGGEDPFKVAMEIGTQAGLPSGGYSAMAKAGEKAFVPKGLTVDNQPMIETSKGHYQFQRADKVPTSASGARINSLTRQLTEINKELAEPDRFRVEKDPAYLPERKQRKAELEKVLDSMNMNAVLPDSLSGGGRNRAPYAEGATIRSKKDGKLYKVVDGEPVPVDEGGDEEEQ